MTETITPDRLAKALDRRGPFTTLSLDCFDTLLWRDVYEPKDLFGLLTSSPRINALAPNRTRAKRARSRPVAQTK